MTTDSSQSAHRSWGHRLIPLGVSVALVAVAFRFLSLVTTAITKVREGKGLETFYTFWLVEFSYIGFLISIAAIFVALIIAVGFWWREERHWRDFERKYGARK
jgi:hypothetical protein